MPESKYMDVKEWTKKVRLEGWRHRVYGKRDRVDRQCHRVEG